MINFLEIIQERKKLKLGIFDKSPSEKTLQAWESEAFQLYLRCRRNYTFFKHKNALREAQNVAEEIERVLHWNSPSFNMNKIEVLREYWMSVAKVLDKQYGE